MIRTFTLKGYRGFDEYELADPTRVNLLVGRNNSGKTSILEAVHFLAARGDPGPPPQGGRVPSLVPSLQ